MRRALSSCSRRLSRCRVMCRSPALPSMLATRSCAPSLKRRWGKAGGGRSGCRPRCRTSSLARTTRPCTSTNDEAGCLLIVVGSANIGCGSGESRSHAHAARVTRKGGAAADNESTLHGLEYKMAATGAPQSMSALTLFWPHPGIADLGDPVRAARRQGSRVSSDALLQAIRQSLPVEDAGEAWHAFFGAPGLCPLS